ncbi:F-box/kelch-repeat protein At3g06240-like [Gastrolobium bilobum]|uniref:F-box/kelch-repeat protein At3g06240-like n=1 Tax=Gastrolobium bilobum TaxID=150636 RepID=UPI002AAF1AC1|nr:F-box/kelch-repeat protein At3g06240-like [Gastrolobium bilobum]
MAKDLGEDLESEILVRLPAKSLMRFKCVQRSWNALFRNHRFLMSHVNMQMSKERLMVFGLDREMEFEKIVSLTCDDPSQSPQYLNCSPLDNSFKFHMSYGSCNGVFCVGMCNEEIYDLSGVYQLILWNPITRESKLIPFPSEKPSYKLHGFGVDPNTNDFKIIKPTINFEGSCRPLIAYAEVYNLSTNSWTSIHVVTLPHAESVKTQYYYSCVLVNGVYHWLIAYEGGFGYILCFDFRNNQFSKLTAPVDLPNDERHMDTDKIAEVNGSLGYIIQYLEQERLEIWIMNEHKWTKTHSVVWPTDIFIFGVWKDGNQLLGQKNINQDKDEKRLTIYNLDAQPFHQFQVLNLHPYSQINKYVESIVPLST